jgi:hypothetical protein
MSITLLRNLPCVWRAISRSLAMSALLRIGWLTSSRIGGLTWLMSSRLGLGPMKLLSDMTMASRIGSIGGFVTWANSCLK